METAPQAISRLLSALETLTREEHLLLEQNRYPEACAIQEREQPLVDRIVALLFEPGVSAALDAGLQQRAQALLNAHATQIERLSTRVHTTRAEIDQIRTAQARIQKLRPSYGAVDSERALSFAGEG